MALNVTVCVRYQVFARFFTINWQIQFCWDSSCGPTAGFVGITRITLVDNDIVNRTVTTDAGLLRQLRSVCSYHVTVLDGLHWTHSWLHNSYNQATIHSTVSTRNLRVGDDVSRLLYQQTEERHSPGHRRTLSDSFAEEWKLQSFLGLFSGKPVTGNRFWNIITG